MHAKVFALVENIMATLTKLFQATTTVFEGHNRHCSRAANENHSLTSLGLCRNQYFELLVKTGITDVHNMSFLWGCSDSIYHAL